MKEQAKLSSSEASVLCSLQKFRCAENVAVKVCLLRTFVSACKGAGAVQGLRKIMLNIPAGVDDGFSLRLGGEGAPSNTSGQRGDLYVVLHVKPHKLFLRRGDHIYHQTKVSFPQLALGAKLSVPTLHGETKLKIPAGTQTGTLFKLRNKGIPHFRGFGKGDQFVEVTAETPTKLSRKQKKLFEELQEEQKD